MIDTLGVLFDEWLKCARCERRMPRAQINTEAVIHHGETELRCLKLRECRRAARKRSDER